MKKLREQRFDLYRDYQYSSNKGTIAAETKKLSREVAAEFKRRPEKKHRSIDDPWHPSEKNF
jgi:hypothetical protein